jgi:hypothetical protein
MGDPLRPQQALRISIGVLAILAPLPVGGFGLIYLMLALSHTSTPGQLASAMSMCVSAGWLLTFGIISIAHVSRPTQVWRFLTAAALAFGTLALVVYDAWNDERMIELTFAVFVVACSTSAWLLVRRVAERAP